MMKRILSIILLCAMLLSLAIVPAFANEPETVTAPVLRAVQTSVNEEDDTTHDIRFLATVSSLQGSALGMEIRATFTLNGEAHSVVYGATDGLEGNKVYSSVRAEVDGERKSVTAQELAGDESAVAIYAAIIRGVPENTDVTFTIKPYVVDHGEKTESRVGVVTWKNNRLTYDFGVVYQENFNDTKISATLEKGNANSGAFADESKEGVKTFNKALQDALGWKITSVKDWGTTGTSSVSASGGQVVLNGAGTTYQLLSSDVLKNAQTYMVDMDLTVKSIGSVLSLFFNSSSDVGYYAGSGQFIRLTKDSESGRIALTPGSYGRKAGAAADYTNAMIQNGKAQPTSAELGKIFHMTLLVDHMEGMVTALINGKQVLALKTDFTGGGGLELHIQEVETTIDNLVVIASGDMVAPANGAVLFEEDFSNYEEGKKPYGKTDNIIGSEPSASVTDGALNAKGEWAITRFIPDSALIGVKRYVLEMDVTIDNAGFLNLIFNTSCPHSSAVYAKSNQSLGTYNALQFRATKSYEDSNAPNLNGPLKANLLTYNGGTVKSLKAFGFVGEGESYDLNTTPIELRSYTFRFAMEVDKEAGTISLYIDGRLLETLSNTEKEQIIPDNCYNGFYFWTQNTKDSVIMDNIRITAGTYADLPQK